MKIKEILRTVVLAAGCLSMGLGVVGCGPKGVSDQTLATDIQAKLFSDPTAKMANVKVSVANGVVTLTGDAPSSDVALQVVNIANGTSGVKSVDNQLKVATASTAMPAEPPPPTTPAPANPTPAPATPAPATTAQNQPPPPSTPPPPMAPMAKREEEPRMPPRPVTVTIPAGTNVGVTMIDSISSKTNTAGQTFRGSLTNSIVVDGRRVLPAGSGATIMLDNAKAAGRIKGSSELEVRLVKIEHAGETYDVDSSVHDEIGKGRGKQTAIRTGIGAAAGAVIGAIAGGGKGAAIGTLAGGGAGASFQLATHGQQVTIPSESELTFTLRSPVVVTLHSERKGREDSDAGAERQ